MGSFSGINLLDSEGKLMRGLKPFVTMVTCMKCPGSFCCSSFFEDFFPCRLYYSSYKS